MVGLGIGFGLGIGAALHIPKTSGGEGDTTAPTLSIASGVQLAQTTATLSVTTNEDNGDLYYVVTSSATPPSKAQVKAGQDHTGAAAMFAGNQAISSTGSKTDTATGLTVGTRHVYFMHEDAAANQSSIATDDWSQGDITAPTLSSPSGTETSDTEADLSVSTDEGNGTLYWVVTTSSSSPSAAQVKAGQDHTGSTAADSGSQAVSGTGTQNAGATGLTAETEYWAHFMQEDAATNQSNVATSSSFTTEAGGGASAEVQQFLDRSSSLDATHVSAYTALIDGLVADGVWSKLDCLYIFATQSNDTRANAKLNLKSSSFPCTESGTVSFTADRGYTGNASDFFLDTQFTPSTAPSPNYTENSASVGAYVLTSSTANSNQKICGADAGGGPMFVGLKNFDANIISAIHAYVAGASNPAGNWQGFWGAIRTTSTNINGYRNASSTPAWNLPATTAGSVPSASLYVFGYRGGGGALQEPTDKEMAAFFIGSSLSGAEWAALADRINAYMTTFSINVY